MWLSSDQQTLVTDHYYLAKITARKKGNRRDPDEALSACHLGMVNAAYYWRPDKGLSFRSFAVRCCHHAIIQDFRQRRPVVGPRSKSPKSIETNCGQIDVVSPYGHPALRLIDIEEIERLESASRFLPESQRKVLHSTLAGKHQIQIQQELGLNRGAVGNRLRRCVARLRSALGSTQ